MPADAAEKHGRHSRIHERIVRRRKTQEEYLYENILREAPYRRGERPVCVDCVAEWCTPRPEVREGEFQFVDMSM